MSASDIVLAFATVLCAVAAVILGCCGGPSRPCLICRAKEWWSK